MSIYRSGPVGSFPFIHELGPGGGRSDKFLGRWGKRSYIAVDFVFINASISISENKKG